MNTGSYDIVPHNGRYWCPAGFPDPREGQPTPTHGGDWRIRGLEYGAVVVFHAYDDLGRTGLVLGEDGSAMWDTVPPEGAFLFDEDGWDTDAHGADQFVELLRLQEPEPSRRFTVRVFGKSAPVRCRYGLDGWVIRFQVLDPTPPFGEPLPPPVAPSSPPPPFQDEQ